ncbi:MAG: hypothetical protein ACFCVK_13520 [Acidimicrobiales bacterium]
MRCRLLSRLAAAALAVVAKACSEATAPAEELAHQFDCANPIDILHEPPDGWPAVLDVIALPDDPVLERSRFDDDIGRSFSKFGLVIRAGVSFTLSIAESSQPNASRGWNQGSTAPVLAIEIPGCPCTCASDVQPNCPLGESGEWIGYPGGVWTIDPACTEIEIATGSRTTTAKLPIGAVEALRLARPLPNDAEMAIEGLTDEEWAAFEQALAER